MCKYVICLPAEHQGVTRTLSEMSMHSRIKLDQSSMLVFEERGNWSTQRKISRSRVENQQQTQPTYDTWSGNQTWDTLVGSKHSHHCAIPAP